MQTPCCVSLFVTCKTSCSCQRSAETSLPIVSHEWHLGAIAAIRLTAARKKSGRSHWKQIFWAQFSDIMCNLWNCKCLHMDFCTDSIQRGIFTHYKHTPVQSSKIPAACCWRRMAYTLVESWSVKIKKSKNEAWNVQTVAAMVTFHSLFYNIALLCHWLTDQQQSMQVQGCRWMRSFKWQWNFPQWSHNIDIWTLF